MARPATPTQLSANNVAATEIADLPEPASAGPSTAALQALVAGSETALHHIDPEGADRETIDLLAEWHDELTALKSDVSGMLHARDADPAGRAGFLEGLRDLLGGHGLKAMVGDGTRLLDRLHDTIVALAAPEAAATLERHRARMVSLVNRAQDRLDG